MNFKRLFKDYVNTLGNCINILTEDNVRYMFYSKMYDQDNNLNNYILESPYCSVQGSPFNGQNFTSLSKAKGNMHKELDLLYKDKGKNIYYAIEIKFHHETNTQGATTSQAGELINDIKRLELIKNINSYKFRKYLVYVTEDEMHRYFINMKNNTNYLKTYLYNLYTTASNNLVKNNLKALTNIQPKKRTMTILKVSSKSFNNQFSLQNISSNLKMIYSSGNIIYKK